jgi:hypothetical protein
MLLDKKSDIETLIIEKYLNKEINLLEKEMAINVLLESCYGEDLDEDDERVFKVLSEQSTQHIVEWIIGFGRDEYNSHKIEDPKYIEFSIGFLQKQREKYINV